MLGLCVLLCAVLPPVLSQDPEEPVTYLVRLEHYLWIIISQCVSLSLSADNHEINRL